MPANKRLSYILLSIPLLLLIPLIAMQFTEEVNWSFFDFLIMGILLLVVGLSIEWVLRKVKSQEVESSLDWLLSPSFY